MHNDHICLGMLHDTVVDDESVFNSLVVREVWEALFLHAGAVQHITAADDLRGELSTFEEQLAALFEALAYAFGKRKRRRRDELNADVVVLQQLTERVHGAAVLEIADERDCEAVDGTEFLTDGKEI